jgi:hypothetical protein
VIVKGSLRHLCTQVAVELAQVRLFPQNGSIDCERKMVQRILLLPEMEGKLPVAAPLRLLVVPEEPKPGQKIPGCGVLPAPKASATFMGGSKKVPTSTKNRVWGG